MFPGHLRCKSCPACQGVLLKARRACCFLGQELGTDGHGVLVEGEAGFWLVPFFSRG